MKIYNKIVIKILTDEVIFEDSFEYSGPIMACKGGGGTSSTVTGDPVYNAGMLALSREQQGWAGEMFDVFKSGVGEGDTSEMQYMQNIINSNQSLLGGQTELEAAQIGSRMELLPGQTELERSRIGSRMELLPGQTELERSRMGFETAQIGAGMELLPGQTALTKLQASDTMTGIKERAPVRTKFFEEAAEGVDANERMNLAQANVAQGFAGAEGTARRNAARMGRSSANIDFSGMATDRAKAIGFARTKARTEADKESFSRLSGAMGVV